MACNSTQVADGSQGGQGGNNGKAPAAEQKNTKKKSASAKGRLGGSAALGETDPGAGGRSAGERQRLEGVTVPAESEIDGLIAQSGNGYYVSLAHLGAGGPASELEVYRYGVHKALNSVSMAPDIVKMKAVDPAESVYLLNPAEFRLSADDMNSILAAPGANAGVRKVGGSVLIQGDWLTYAVTRPEIYDHIMRIPNDVGSMERQAGVNRNNGVITADIGDGQSEVTFGRRVLERVSIEVGGQPGGYYWRSYDPFTALMAGEFFFSLPNGLQAYMLSGFVDQHRIDAQPFVATDRNRPQDGLTQCVGGEAPCGYVINGESCITCHANGVKMNKNFSNVQGGSTADFEAWLAADADRFASALAKLGFDSIGVEPVLETVKTYQKVSGNRDVRQGGSEVNPVFATGGIFER